MTATAAANGRQQLSAAADNAGTIRASLGYVRPEKRKVAVQLACNQSAGDHRSGRTSVVIVALVVPLGPDAEAERIRDPVISAARLMLMISTARSPSCPIHVIRPLRAAPLSAANWLPVPQIMNVTAVRLGAAAALAAAEADDGLKTRKPSRAEDFALLAAEAYPASRAGQECCAFPSETPSGRS